MNEHIEIEYKILLDENTFYWILQDYQSLIQRDYIQCYGAECVWYAQV